MTEDLYKFQEVCRVDLMSPLCDVDEGGTVYKAFSRPHSTIEVRASTILAVVSQDVQNNSPCHPLSFIVSYDHIQHQSISFKCLHNKIVFFSDQKIL